MSLSSHLCDRHSPVRGFFEQQLGETRPIVAEANVALRAGQTAPPVAGHGNAFLVGTAVDVLLNAWLDPSAPPARMAAAPTMESAQLLLQSQLALRNTFAGGDDPTGDEWSTLARHALMLASFVIARRSRQGMIYLRERLAGVPADFGEYARRLWHPADVDDVLGLAAAAFEDFGFARSAAQLAVGPSFDLSGRLGGADGDLIVDGTLWDYKASRQMRIVRREEIWQLTGYRLADTEDRFGLRAVGIAALRWRTRHSWTVDDLLSRLSGRDGWGLAVWRSAFEHVVRRERTPGSTRVRGPSSGS